MVEALVLSIDEPQLDRCLKSIRNQTVPFSNIVHINNVVPQSEAYNRGLLQLKDEWFMKVDGDCILYPNAVEMCIKAIEVEKSDDKIICHAFRLYDAFLRAFWGGTGVFKTSILQAYPIENKLTNDTGLGMELDHHGWRMKRHMEKLGIHFDSPDEYQVFRRFYVVGMKYNSTSLLEISNVLRTRERKSKNSLYSLALKAMDFAGTSGGKHRYPGSHNVEFEKKMYEEFNAIPTTSAS